MEISEGILTAIRMSNVVVVVGPPGAGKSTFTNSLKESFPEFTFFHTDDYIKFGFKDALYMLMDEIRALCQTDGKLNKVIVEGIQTARLLRKWLETDNFIPDLIIKFEIDPNEVIARYCKRENATSYPGQTAKAVATVFGEFASAIAGREDQPTILLIEE